MDFSLSASLGNYLVKTVDADAQAYISAVTATGTSVSATQRMAITNFYRNSKLNGYYASLKRLYLPIWGSASANSIDLISLTNGTFVGNVTHGAGFAKGDGATGYFDFGVSPSTLGLTASSQSMFALVKTLSAAVATTNYLLGSFSSASQALVLGGQWRGIINTATGVGNISATAANPTGIVMLDRASGNRGIYVRRTAGLTTVIETTSADAGAIPTVNMHAWSLNTVGVPAISRNDELGFYGISMGLGSTNRSQFSSAVKTLWETCTGLTLP